jgi:hypothetical protein
VLTLLHYLRFSLEFLKEQYYLRFFLVFSQLTNQLPQNIFVEENADDKGIFTTRGDSVIAFNILQDHLNLLLH